MVFFELAYFSSMNAIIEHVATMVTNQVAERKDQYPFSLSLSYTYICIHMRIHTDTRSNVNVSENKEANQCVSMISQHYLS